jgi:hypothetical protein
MTALDLITRALRKIKVLASGESPTSDEADDCLLALNDMLASWSINGLDIAHTTLALTDTLDVPDDHLEAIRLSLAENVAGDFGAQMAQADVIAAQDARAALKAYHFSIKAIGIDHPAAARRSSDC